MGRGHCGVRRNGRQLQGLGPGKLNFIKKNSGCTENISCSLKKFLTFFAAFAKITNAETEYGRLAQLVAHPLDVREVTSSSLVSSTMKTTLKSVVFLYFRRILGTFKAKMLEPPQAYPNRVPKRERKTICLYTSVLRVLFKIFTTFLLL